MDAITRSQHLPAGRLARFRHADINHGFGQATDLAYDHPAVVEGHTIFPSTVVPPGRDGPVLVSGANNPKIGSRIEKGAWAGMPVYTLTLEERATCSRSCHHWRTCFGSNMHLARRNEAGPELESQLAVELGLLQEVHPGGFVVRLHVLGDFYSVAYVGLWQRWLDLFPALRCYGYSAWPPATPIGAAVRRLATARWERFAIRLSVPVPIHGEMEAVTWWGTPETFQAARAAGEEPLEGALLCPAQAEATETCGTCALCWSAPERSIAFAVHGRKLGRPAGDAEPRGERIQPKAKASDLEAVAAAVRAAGQVAMPQLRQGLPAIPLARLRLALLALRDAGQVVAEGQRRAMRYRWAGAPETVTPAVLPDSRQATSPAPMPAPATAGPSSPPLRRPDGFPRDFTAQQEERFAALVEKGWNAESVARAIAAPLEAVRYRLECPEG